MRVTLIQFQPGTHLKECRLEKKIPICNGQVSGYKEKGARHARVC